MDFDIELALEKVQYILDQKKEEELEEDALLKHIIELIFKSDNIINYPRIYDPKNILDGFIEIIYELFRLRKNKRQIFYKTAIDNIKNEIIINNVKNCKQFENTKFYLNEDLKELYEIIKKIHFKETYSLFDFLDKIASNLCFMLDERRLLEFKIYSIIDKHYMNKYHRAFEEKEIELDLNSQTCITLITDIISNKFKGDKLLFLCILTLKYRNIHNKFKKVNLFSIVKACENVESKKINLNKVSNKEIITLICNEIANNEQEKIGTIETNNDAKECAELALKKNNLIDLKYDSNNIKNINNDKFWDNFAYKSILDELIKIIINNTKMDDYLKEELNQKFNELKEFMNKLMNNNNHLNDKVNSLKDEVNTLKDEVNSLKGDKKKIKFDMDTQIEKLKENLMEKEKSLNAVNNKLDKIYENLICPISLSIIEEPVICPSGITYEKKNLYDWFKKQKVEPCSKEEITEEKLYPNNALKNVIEAFKNDK